MNTIRNRILTSGWLIHLCLIFLFPIGLYALWKSDRFSRWWKITATMLVLIVVVICFGPYDSASYTEPKYNSSLHKKLGLSQHKLINNHCVLTYWTKDNHAGKWIIFLHGAGADHRMFLEQARAITNYNVLLIDGRGQGKSRMIDQEHPVGFDDMIDDVIQVMNKNGIDQSVLIAQSLGASLAQEIAFQHPDRVNKLVLISCYSHHEETGAAWKARNLMMTLILKIAPWSSLADQFGTMTSEDKQVKEYTIECLLSAGRDNWKNLGLSAYRYKHQVDSYTRPHETLLLRGEKDYPEMLSGIYTRMKEKNPQAREVVIANAGHLCNMENSTDVNQSILDFIK